MHPPPGRVVLRPSPARVLTLLPTAIGKNEQEFANKRTCFWCSKVDERLARTEPQHDEWNASFDVFQRPSAANNAT